MKKSFYKKCLSILLSLAILMALFVIPTAAIDGCDCGYLPVVYIGPLGCATIYQDADTEDEQVVFRPDSETIKKLVGDLIPAVSLFAINKDYDKFGDSLIDAILYTFGPLEMDDDGNSSERLTIKTELPTDPEHGPDRSYYFKYDFRIDPLETAVKLNEFIHHVKDLTGHDKVLIRASSMGGIVAMAYIHLYGTQDIDACIFQCCPILGTDVGGELLTKQLNLNSDALVKYASQALEEDFTGFLLNTLIVILDSADVFDSLVSIGNDLIENLVDKVYDEFLFPVLGKAPGLWGFVPDEYYEQAKSMALDENVNSVLIDRIDDYHYNVMCNADKILNNAVEDGVRIMILAGYNMQRTPLVVSYKNDSDATVDTKHASAGATVALLGETLADGYAQKVQCGHDHISEDGRIDASTCALPEHTWFVKDMLHCNIHDGFKGLYNWFFYSDEYVDVFSNDQYPQFLQNDKKNMTLIPMGSLGGIGNYDVNVVDMVNYETPTSPTENSDNDSESTAASAQQQPQKNEPIPQTGAQKSIQTNTIIMVVAILGFVLIFAFIIKRKSCLKE